MDTIQNPDFNENEKTIIIDTPSKNLPEDENSQASTTLASTIIDGIGFYSQKTLTQFSPQKSIRVSETLTEIDQTPSLSPTKRMSSPTKSPKTPPKNNIGSPTQIVNSPSRFAIFHDAPTQIVSPKAKFNIKSNPEDTLKVQTSRGSPVKKSSHLSFLMESVRTPVQDYFVHYYPKSSQTISSNDKIFVKLQSQLEIQNPSKFLEVTQDLVEIKGNVTYSKNEHCLYFTPLHPLPPKSSFSIICFAQYAHLRGADEISLRDSSWNFYTSEK